MQNSSKHGLPENYTYICQKYEENEKIFRVKELTTQSAAEIWLKEYSEQNCVTWRVFRTYPKCGRKNLFKKDYRCQYSTDKRVIGARKSKNTDCPAKLMIIVNRIVENSKAKITDPLKKNYPGRIVVKGDHNHPISNADGSLRPRAEECRKRFRCLRDRFTKEKKVRKSDMLTDPSLPDIYKKMLFLWEHLQHRNSYGGSFEVIEPEIVNAAGDEADDEVQKQVKLLGEIMGTGRIIDENNEQQDVIFIYDETMQGETLEHQETVSAYIEETEVDSHVNLVNDQLEERQTSSTDDKVPQKISADDEENDIIDTPNSTDKVPQKLTVDEQKTGSTDTCAITENVLQKPTADKQQMDNSDTCGITENVSQKPATDKQQTDNSDTRDNTDNVPQKPPAEKQQTSISNTCDKTDNASRLQLVLVKPTASSVACGNAGKVSQPTADKQQTSSSNTCGITESVSQKHIPFKQQIGIAVTCDNAVVLLKALAAKQEADKHSKVQNVPEMKRIVEQRKLMPKIVKRTMNSEKNNSYQQQNKKLKTSTEQFKPHGTDESGIAWEKADGALKSCNEAFCAMIKAYLDKIQRPERLSATRLQIMTMLHNELYSMQK